MTTLLLLCVVLISVAGVKSTTKKGAVGGTAVRKTTVKKVAVKNKNIQRMNQKRWREPPRDCSDAPKHLKQTCLMVSGQ